ncbi:MAG: hypothetical protein AB7P22_13010, partial [Vicinamibacterales bacterium]
MTQATEARRGPEPPDLAEKGGVKNGEPQRLNERLFMQLLAFGGCTDSRPLADALAASGLTAVLYEDIADPRGVALLTLDQDPNVFIDRLRPLLNRAPFYSLQQKPGLTMLGRTNSIGYEPDLREVLLERPKRTDLNPAWNWAVWNPLRRNGRFAQLPPEE